MRILVAIDGSDDAKAAVAWLGHLPLLASHELMILTAVTLPRTFAEDTMEHLRSVALTQAQKLVDETAAALTRRAAPRTEVVEGDPRDVIVTTAREWNADLIAMGARGLGAVARFLLGSVSLAVAREAPCPVLVCKGAPRELRAVTVALDGSDHARRALDWLATSLSLPTDVRVRVLGVAEPQHYPATAPAIVAAPLRAAAASIDAERRAALEKELSTAAKGLAARLPAFETVVTTGVPADVIVQDAAHSSADLLVVGARGLGGLRRLLLGSVSETVLTHAACSVLVVRSRKS